MQIQVCCLGNLDPRLIPHVPRGGYIEGTISIAKSLATAVYKGGLGFSGWACLDDGTFCATHSLLAWCLQEQGHSRVSAARRSSGLRSGVALARRLLVVLE